MKQGLSRPQWLCVAYLILHTLAHVSAHWFEVRPGVSVSIWYAPCGLALSLLVLLGPRYAPVVFLANFATAWITVTPRVAWTAWFFPSLITANYCATAWVVRRYVGTLLLPGGRLGTPIFFLAVGVAPMVAAIIGTIVVDLTWMEHGLNAVQFARSAFDWWVGDFSGLLTVVPVAMVFVSPWLKGLPPPIDPARLSAGGIILAFIRVLVLLGTVVLVLAVPVLRDHNAFFLCFLPLVWICVHHGMPGATLATLLVTMVGLIGMRFTGTTAHFTYVFLLFEVAVAGVGLGLGTLVTHRREAEAKLSASQAQLDRVIAGAQLGLWDWDIAGRQVASNERLAGMLGYRLEEIEPLSERWPALIHPSDQPKAQSALDDHLGGRSSLYEAEFRLRAKDGGWRWIQSRGSVVLRDGRQVPLRVSGTHVDITERKHAEAEVRRLLRIIEATPDFVLTTDTGGRVIYANVALLSVRGTGEKSADWVGRSVTEMFPGDCGRRLRDEVIAAALAAGSWRGEIAIEDLSGRLIPTSQVVLTYRDAESDTVTVSFIMRDISDQKRAEAERIERERKLLQLQKDESLGVLAGGVAHDFNNLLTTVVGNANLVRLELGSERGGRALLDNIEKAAARASALCNQMLAYAGRTPVAFSETDINPLIRSSFQLLGPSLSKKLQILFELQQPLALILAEPMQIQQVITNLVLNAADAIGEGSGRLTVRTRSQSLAPAALGALFPGQCVAAGPHVILEVADSGCGMTPEIQARIFEPFYTTKFTGQGLGLAAVVGVVKSHRGAIGVESAPGLGSTFRIAFPALKAGPLPPAVEPSADESWRGSGLVLVVDDEPQVREVTTLLLGALGFETVVARDGIEGVAAFQAHAARLRCVLLDLTMPRMDGFEAHTAMHRHNPSVPVILISGYSQKLAHLPPEAIHPAGVLAKPFGINQLRTRLKSVLTPPSPGSPPRAQAAPTA